MGRLISHWPQATLADLRALEATLGRRLPPSYAALMLRTNGGRASPPFVTDSGGDRRLLGVVFPVTDDTIVQHHAHFVGGLAEATIPIGTDGGGNYFLLALTDGRIYFWDHDQHDSDVPPASLPIVSTSLPSLVGELEGDEETEPVGVELTARTRCELGAWEGTPEQLHQLAIAASRTGNQALLSDCIRHGVEHRGLLTTAVLNGKLQIVEYLLQEVGVDANEPDDAGRRPLSYAVEATIRRRLREAGAM